jgi:hypothetical protein
MPSPHENRVTDKLLSLRMRVRVEVRVRRLGLGLTGGGSVRGRRGVRG